MANLPTDKSLTIDPLLGSRIKILPSLSANKIFELTKVGPL